MSEKEKICRIDNWSVVPCGCDPYLPPEAVRICLHGFVLDHPTLGMRQRDNGHGLKTSAVVSVSGRIVECVSRKYKLGTIDPGYRKWLRENRPNWNWRNPITVKKVSDEEGQSGICRVF